MRRLLAIFAYLAFSLAILMALPIEGHSDRKYPLIALAVGNLLVGMRIGYSSVRRFACDVQRTNRRLLDLNDQLAAANQELLAELGKRANHHGEAAAAH